MPRVACPLLAIFLLASAIAGAAHASPDRVESLVIVAPDVELVVDERPGTVLPSAERSEALVARWPAAAAAALGLDGPAAAWHPPTDLRDDTDLAQVLALQEAVASALLERDVRPRGLSLGAGARRMATVTGATHALFARIRATPRQGTAVAMLVDLRNGAVLRHRVATGVDAREAADGLAAALSVDLLKGWRGLPALVSGHAFVDRGAPTPTPTDDVGRASERMAQRLLRYPHRVHDPGLDAFLRDVACRVDVGTCASLQPIVLDEPGAYAGILPDGTLVLHTGLLLRLRDEAELAFVLAHELAHVRHDDVQARLAESDASRRRDVSLTREAVADRDGSRRVVAAGYDAAAAVSLWTRLSAEQAANAAAFLPGSHPSAAERLAAARTVAADSRGGDRGLDRWEKVAAPRRDGWLATELAAGDPEATVAMLEAALGDRETPPATGAREAWSSALAVARARRDGTARADAGPPDAVLPTPTPRGGTTETPTVRALGLRLPTRLPWRQRPGIGAIAWTVDGTPLNRLQIVTVGPGRTLLNDSAPGAPRWEPGLSGATTTARLVTALRRAHWTGVRTHDARPHDFGGVRGWRVELTLADSGGLRYRGTLAHAVDNGRLTWAMWLAPEEVYYPRDAADVAAMLDGMRFPR